MAFRIGDRVKDKITGYTGIITKIESELSIDNPLIPDVDCHVQSEGIDEDGAIIECHEFDIEQLEMVAENAVQFIIADAMLAIKPDPAEEDDEEEKVDPEAKKKEEEPVKEVITAASSESDKKKEELLKKYPILS